MSALVIIVKTMTKMSCIRSYVKMFDCAPVKRAEEAGAIGEIKASDKINAKTLTNALKGGK